MHAADSGPQSPSCAVFAFIGASGFAVMLRQDEDAARSDDAPPVKAPLPLTLLRACPSTWPGGRPTSRHPLR